MSDSGVHKVVDQETGLTIATAVGPVARLRWLHQVQADARLREADLAVAVALEGFVNSKDGFAFPGQGALGKKIRVAERTARRRLAALVAAGHVHQMRRRRKPAALYLVLQESHNRSDNGRSNNDQDRPSPGRSYDSEIKSRPASSGRQDRPLHNGKTGQSQNLNNTESVGCEPITQRVNSATELGAVAAARPRARAAASSHSREILESPERARPKARSQETEPSAPDSESSSYGALPDDTPMTADIGELDRAIARERIVVAHPAASLRPPRPAPREWAQIFPGVDLVFEEVEEQREFDRDEGFWWSG